MTVDVKLMDTTNKSVIFEMRRSGMPMRKIGEKIGRSRERVRQILIKSLGTTNHEYLSTSQLCSQSGMSRNRIVDLYLDGIITPNRQMGCRKPRLSFMASRSCKKNRCLL